VAGHNGMVGRALVRVLAQNPHHDIIVKSHEELDLTEQGQVRAFFQTHPIDQVYMAAAKVGGIHANNEYPADFIADNLAINLNVIHEAAKVGVRQLLFLGSSCIYPKNAPQPMTESALLTGSLEPTNEPYAIAKIAGIKLCESLNRQYGSEAMDYRTIMPTNLYGPFDNYHPLNSHVLPALIRRFHEAMVRDAPSVTVWGSGRARREFLHVDDCAQACVTLMNVPIEQWRSMTSPQCAHVNVGFGEDITIGELTHLIAAQVGYTGTVLFDHHKPDGPLRKILDSSLLRKLGWQPTIPLDEGIRRTYHNFLTEQHLI